MTQSVGPGKLYSRSWFVILVLKWYQSGAFWSKCAQHVDLDLVLLFLFSHPVVSDSLRPHGPQHTSPPCPSPSPEVCLSSCPLHQWCHPAMSSSDALILLLPLIFPNIRDFSSESAILIRWPKYWNFSFSISPSKEYSGLISFKTDWFDLLSVQVSYFCIKYYKIYNMSDFFHILKSCLNFFFKEQSRI